MTEEETKQDQPEAEGISDEDKELLTSTPEEKDAPVDIKGTTVLHEDEAEEEPAEEEKPAEAKEEMKSHIFALRTTANREDQVLAFVGSHAARKKLPVYSVISPHGMRGYIFVEAADRISAEQAAQGVPYAKGLLPNEVDYAEIEHMLEQVKKDVNIQKNDIVEIISGPFKRENAKITRVDKAKDEVVVELLEAAVPIPITLKIDDVKVIRREE
ncbi:transcription elongation factor Spt5 [Candidatus Woesearchaeota archaeon]|nr:transcription elongation factor Spt5 [Candidatus Woesearchaeota archaeon]